ncbi:hypothetical protein BV20DRAFT_962875 [Pilatotrama ljubarskyi]|nr:hypothetical protein BV20DRAFT_962875 [Pilatotrama ljubarskyi]
MATVSPIFRLCDDVLLWMFAELLRQKCLHSLSATCRYLRYAAQPILYKYCQVRVFRRIDAEIFPPPSLWPYFQYVTGDFLADTHPHVSVTLGTSP